MAALRHDSQYCNESAVVNTIAYLVSNNPDTSEDEALEPPVDSPGSPAGDLRAGGGKQLLGRGCGEVGVNVGGGGPAGGSEKEVAGEVK